MATTDVTSYVSIKRVGHDPESGLGVIYVHTSGLPAPPTTPGDIWQLVKVPDGCVPIGWAMSKNSTLGTTVTGDLQFTGKTAFLSGATLGGTTAIGFTPLAVSLSAASGGTQDSQNYLEIKFTSVSGGAANGAFDLIVLYYKV